MTEHDATSLTTAPTPGRGERQSLEELIDTMSRFITAALGGRLPSES